MKLTRRQKAATLLVTGFALLGSTPAFAHQINANNDNGSKAWSWNDHSRIAIQDTMADSRAAYADYHRRSSRDLEIRNNSGAGSIVTSAPDATNYVIQLRACTAINLKPDICTSWKGL